MSFALVILCAVLVTVLAVCLSSQGDAVAFVCVLVTFLDSKVYAAIFGYVLCAMLVSSLPARFWLWIADRVLVPLKNWVDTLVVSLAGSFVADAMLLLSKPKLNIAPLDEPGDSQRERDSEVQSPAGLGQDGASSSTYQDKEDPDPPVEFAILRKRKPFKVLDEAFRRRVEAAKERERQKGPVVLAPDTEATRERDRRLWVQVRASRMAMAMSTPRNEGQAAEVKASDEEVVELPQSHTILPMTPETTSTEIMPATLYTTPMTPEMTLHKARFPGAFSISSGSDSGDELQTPSGSEYGADGSKNIEEYNEEYDEDVEEYEEDEGEESEGEERQYGEVGGQIGSGESGGEGSDEDGKSEVEVGSGEHVENEDGIEGGEHVEIGGELDESKEQNPGTLLIGNSARVPVGTSAFVNKPTIVTDTPRSTEGAQVSERERVEARTVGAEETTSNEQVAMNGTSVARRTDGDEITNDGNGEAEANNRASDSQVNHSVQVSDEVEEQASIVDSTGSPILGPAGPTIVVDAPPVMGGAQTVEQGQAYAGVEEVSC
ncbi:hypothetical protein FRC12_005396 [Ceratobasidium sp. 428]|nr:hypothetical protein FRC12_005396 [Ceratobasidium sp. 428]